MEEKLYRAAAALPLPQTDYLALEDMAEKSTHKQKTLPLRRRTVAIVLVLGLLLLLCGMGWAKTQYGMWLLCDSHAWSDLEMEAERYDCRLPRELDGIPFLNMQVYGHVPQGASHVEALLNPRYRPVKVEYGYHQSETGRDCESEMGWDEQVLGVSFGTTENELWRYYFEMDENGVWTACGVPDSYGIVEYKGIILQIGDQVHYDELLEREVYTRWVHWVDKDRQVAFAVHETDYAEPDRVVECAKQIIDLNS